MKDDDVKISFRVSLEVKQLAEKCAKERGCTVAAYMRRAFEKSVNPADAAHDIMKKQDYQEWLLQSLGDRDDLIISVLEDLAWQVLSIRLMLSDKGLTCSGKELKAEHDNFKDIALENFKSKEESDLLPRALDWLARSSRKRKE